jgi:histidine triad (HIT) family protein
MECLFCKIAKKLITASTVYEDDHAIAFLDTTPRTLGHTLVISKYHASALKDLPDEEVGPLFSAVKKVAVILEKQLQSDGITIGINQGAASGQVVEHVHIHLMPRWRGDRGHSIQSVVDAPPGISQEEVMQKIKRGT